MNDNAQIALQRSTNRRWLLARLMNAKSHLLSKYALQFKSPVFDFDTKRLIGSNGYVLQWLLRNDPQSEVSYDNQQTSIGIVVCVQTEETK